MADYIFWGFISVVVYVLGWRAGRRWQRRIDANEEAQRYWDMLESQRQQREFHQEINQFNAPGWSVSDQATREKAIGNRRHQLEVMPPERGINA